MLGLLQKLAFGSQATGSLQGSIAATGLLQHSLSAFSRGFSKRLGGSRESEAQDALQPFLASNVTAPPVRFVKGLEQAPTALSWLRRRGPPGLHHGLLYRAFRERQVRVFNGQKVTRCKRSQILSPGDVLLYPRELLAQARGWSPAAIRAATAAAASPAGTSSEEGAGPDPGSIASSAQDHSKSRRAPLASPTADVSAGGLSPTGQCAYAVEPGGMAPGLVESRWVTPLHIRSWVLGATRDLLFLNKPAGISVQGSKHSIGSHLSTALQSSRGDDPRLVHRLDRNVTGLLAIARSAEAASWLAAAFRARSEGELVEDGEEDEGRGARADGEEVERSKVVSRTYWALVAGSLPPRSSGRIRFPVLVPENSPQGGSRGRQQGGEGKKFMPAITHYKVKHTMPGLSLVELEPVTGRRHQLRVHCQRVLGAPIVGDLRYGYEGVTPTKALAEALPPAWWEAFSPQTALDALNPPSRKDRRRAAAAAARARAEARARAQGKFTGDDGDDDEGRQQEDGQAEGGRAGADGAPQRAQLPVPPTMPVFLHARKMVIRKPGARPLRVVAPLPDYFRDAMLAAGWPVPEV